MKSYKNAFCIALILSLTFAGSAFGASKLAETYTGDSAVQFNPNIAYESLTLTVSGPDGSERYVFDSAEVPFVSVFDDFGNLRADGQYTWELRIAPVLSSDVKDALADARQRGDDDVVAKQLAKSGLLPDEGLRTQSGSFRIVNGLIPNANLAEERAQSPVSLEAPALDGPTSMSAAAQTFATDLIVQGSACIGFDCVSSESFGFDTLRLKENNLRIHFNDTSASASFPSNDWRLGANETTNGGANKFFVEDSTAGRNPFTIEAGAQVNTLYVEADGDVGIKTSEPVVDLHIVEGNTPTLRLEQDGSDGFASQTWDLAGNEANFFIRDVTNGSKLSFRIKPGAPEDSIYLDSDNQVGLGTDNPAAAVHVRRTDGTAQLLVEDTLSPAAAITRLIEVKAPGRAEIALNNTSVSSIWGFSADNGGSFVVTKAGSGVNEMVLSGTTGDVVFQGTVSANAGANTLPDFVFEPTYNLMPLDELKSFIETERHLPRIPSVDEVEANGGTIDMSTMQLRLLEKVEELTLYTLQQQDTIRQLQERLDGMESAQQ
ncbi:MAG: hypothetical protein AAF604_18320 [Acidobacteriota bacterium]